MRYLAFLAMLLAGCTANTITRAQYVQNGNPDHVRRCEYEASKATSSGYVTRSSFGQALEDKDKQAEVFNACMKYLSGR